MKRNTLLAAVALVVIGIVTARIGGNLSTTTEGGVMQDSLLMPIGALLFVLGLLGLVIAILWYVVDFVKGRLKKK